MVSSKALKFITLLIVPFLMGQSCSVLNFSSTNPDGGVWMSNDQGNTWIQSGFVRKEKKKDVTLNSTNVNALVFHPLDSRVIYVSTDKGVLYTEDAAQQWNFLRPTDAVFDIEPDPFTIGVVYVSLGNRIAKTVNHGGEWIQQYVESRGGVIIRDIAVDPANTQRVYAGLSTGDLLVSYDGGNTWRQQYTFDGELLKIIISPYDTNEMHIATARRGLWVTFDGGETWESLNEALAPFNGARNYRQLILDETRKGTLLYASDYGLLWTFDSGKHWHPVELVTPPGAVLIRTVALNADNPRDIYYATDRVIYHTRDGGINWLAQNAPSSRTPWIMRVDFNNPDTVYLGVRTLKKK